MTTEQEDHKRALFQGEALVASTLAGLIRSGCLPVALIESYVAGMVRAAGACVTAYVSEKAAYDVLQQAADRTGAHRAVEPGMSS